MFINYYAKKITVFVWKGLVVKWVVISTFIFGFSWQVAADTMNFKEGLALKSSNNAFCSNTAFAAFKACQNELKDDYWINVGNCNNLSEPASRSQCLADTKKEYMEERSLCKEQLSARLEICDELGETPYDPIIIPSDFVDFEAVIEGSENLYPNTYFPLIPGTVQVYLVKNSNGENIEKIRVEILNKTKKIMGVNCIVVRDRVWEFTDEGEKVLIEDTDDWYAQDLKGNVWYFGERSKNYEDGNLVDLEGSWEAGCEFDRAGMFMPAEPKTDTIYRQEFSLGNAEDMGQIADYIPSIQVQGVTYFNVLKTKDFTPIDPYVFEFKYYAPEIGLILEENPESNERVVLKKILSP